jgi:Protein of unknown function (DUF3667)
MSGEIEALGGLATGVLIASSVDDPLAEDGAMQAKCQNCGSPLSGRFCHACGQPGHVHRSVIHMLEEFLHGILHFDTKAWRTLPMLAFRPGKLTRDYVYGHRARYISPLALFLFTIFLMFFAFSFMHPLDNANVNLNVGSTTVAEAQQDVNEARADLATARKELANEEAELARIEKDPAAGPGEAGGQIGAIAGAKAAFRSAERLLDRREAALKEVKAKPVDKKRVTVKTETWQDKVREAAENGDIEIGFSAAIEKKALAALQNPDLVLYKIQQKAYKLSFLLIPMSLPFIWILFFWKRNVKMYDHIVFVLYSLSFMSLLFVMVSFLNLAGVPLGGWVTFSLFIISIAHMYVQLKGAYALRKRSAIWRTLALGVSALIVLLIFATLIATMGLID